MSLTAMMASRSRPSIASSRVRRELLRCPQTDGAVRRQGARVCRTLACRRDGCEDTEGKASPHPVRRAFGGKELNLRADVNGGLRQAATVPALQGCLPRGRVVTVASDPREGRAGAKPLRFRTRPSGLL